MNLLENCETCKSDSEVDLRGTRCNETSRDAGGTKQTFVDVGGISLLSRLIALFLVSGWGGGFFAGLFLLSRCLSSSGGFATGGGLLLCGFWRHF